MNIFELLKHKNHDLEVVKVDKDTIAFGCCTCGVEILNSSCLDHEYDKILNMKSSMVDCEAEEIVLGLKAFDKAIFNLYHEKIKDFIDSEKFYAIVKEDMDYNEDEYVWLSLEDLLFARGYLSEWLIPDGHDNYWIERILSDDFGAIEQELTEYAYKVLTEKHKFDILKYGESTVVSNKIIENNSKDDLYILDKVNIAGFEEENPTVTDIKTFENEIDFSDYLIKADKNEFIYRIKSNLIDISNLNMDKCIERYDAFCGKTKLSSLLIYLKK